MKLFFSGGENNKHAKKMFLGGAENILLSYYYMRQKRIQTPQAFEYAQERPNMKFMIDSGAHTIQQGDVSGGSPERFYMKYCEDYLNWALKNKDKIFAVVELDIEESTSLELVEKLQTRLFKPFEKESGVPVIYVWHKERGYDGWERMCREHSYVGLPDDVPGERFRAMINVASRYKAKVHGFAMTKPDLLMKAPFYTVDSTRWLTGEQYGCLFIWWKRALIELRKDDKQYRKRYKTYFERIGCDWKKIESEDLEEIGKANVIAWIECEKYINQRTQSQQWWLTEDVKSLKDLKKSSVVKIKIKTKSDTCDQVGGPEMGPNGAESNEKALNVPQNTPIDPKSLPAAVGYKNPPVLDDQDRDLGKDLLKREHIETSLICNNCYAKATCPKFKENSVCTLIPTFQRFESTNPHDCVRKIKETIEVLESRAWRGFYFEQLDGGVADKGVTSQFKELIEHHSLLAKMYQEILPQKDKITIEGSQVLERIFGPKNIINIPPENAPQDAQDAEIIPKDEDRVSKGEINGGKTPENGPQSDETPQDDPKTPESPKNAPETQEKPSKEAIIPTEGESFLTRLSSHERMKRR